MERRKIVLQPVKLLSILNLKFLLVLIIFSVSIFLFTQGELKYAKFVSNYQLEKFNYPGDVTLALEADACKNSTCSAAVLMMILGVILTEIFVILRYIRIKNYLLIKRVLVSQGLFLLALFLYLLSYMYIKPGLELLILNQRASSNIKRAQENLNNTPSPNIDKITSKIIKDDQPFLISERVNEKVTLIMMDLDPTANLALANIYTAIKAKDKISFNKPILFSEKFNLLVINKLTKDDVKNIIGPIGEKIASKILGIEPVKNTLDVVDKEDYDKIAEKKKDELIKLAEEAINMLKKNMEDNKNYVQNSYKLELSNSGKLLDYVEEVNNYYRQCIFSYGPENELCKDALNKKENAIRQTDEANKKIRENKSLAEGIIRSDEAKIAEVGKNLEEFKKDPVTPELQLGTAFNDEKAIYIKYDPLTPPSYFPYIIVHEYLHLYSYSPNSYLNVATEEGMTDYLTTSNLNKKSDIKQLYSYEYESKIIEEIAKVLSDHEIISTYQNKKQTKLENELNTKLGEDKSKKIFQNLDLIYLSLNNSTQRESYFQETLALFRY